jgi:outer membrane protein assembly factor BamB
VTSLDPLSGKVYKQGRLRDALEHYYASPIAADGKIYAVSEGGKVVVIQAGPQWQVLSPSDLGEDTYATPAVAGNHIYLRTMSTLYCFGNLQD